MLEILKATFIAGIPVGLIAFAMMYWAMRKGIALEKPKKKNRSDGNEGNQHSKPENSTNNLVFKKWFTFGGGFYGLMALITYVHVEVLDLWRAFSQFSSFSDLWNSMSIGFLIGLLTEAIGNFVTAIMWFAYWNGILPINNGWIWLIVCYLAFVAAEKLIERFTINQQKV